MKSLLTIAAVVLLAAVAGWLTFNSSEDSVTVKVNRVEIGEDVKDAADVAREVRNDVSKEVEELTNPRE